MKLTPTEIPDVVLIEPDVFRDSRGWFAEVWHAEKFRAHGLDRAFVQDNHSRSIRHTLRGLHYQLGMPQGKLVRVVAGEVFDVAVDLRRGSPTFGRWVGVTLSDENMRMLWIPEGFAHGFLVTSERADLTYKCTAPYVAAGDRSLRWDDPEVAIAWPLPSGVAPLLSPKDAAAPGFAGADGTYYD